MATKEYTLRVKIHGKTVLQPGAAVQLTDEQAGSDFWRNRINGAPTPAVKEPAKLTKTEVIEQLKAKGVKFNGNASVDELTALLNA